MNENPVDTALLSGSFGLVSFLNADRREIQLTPRHITRYEVTFEMVATEGVLQASEVLKEFRISYGGRVAYSGRATITSITPSGNRVLYCASLAEPWAESGLTNFDRATLGLAYDGFLDCWRRYYQVRPEFKVIVADMQSLLTDLELWLSQLEVGLDAPGDHGAMEELRLRWARELAGRTTATLNALFEKFESAAAAAPPESRAAYRNFARRQLHPLLLCSPFLHRTFREPLGYAGDFEMVNMITREPHEGRTLYAKLVNAWFLQQAPSEAHRNRLTHLRRRILEVAIQAGQAGRPARVLSLGCGPAVEIQEYLARNQYPGLVEFTLLDFNQETLDQTRRAMEKITRSHRQPARIDYVRKSVMAILKESGAARERPQYDMVYCAGLFDYLTDPVCRRLSTQLYSWLRTGGLFLSTNVHDSNPWPLLMDFIADWHLIHRSSEQMLATRPETIDPGDCVLTADATGVNVFLEVKKMEDLPCG